MSVEYEGGDPRELWVKGFDAYVQDIENALKQLALSFQPRIEAWMKENANWTDQTGNARQSLHVEIAEYIGEVALYLMHGVEYGIFLELANQGRFSILMPALDYWGPQIWAAVEELFR